MYLSDIVKPLLLPHLLQFTYFGSYPGGPLFNPLGLAKDIENAHEEKLKEIKNGSFNSSQYILPAKYTYQSTFILLT